MARRKAWCLLGHSNAEGLAGCSPMLAAASWLQPPGGVTAPVLTPASSPLTVDYQTVLRRYYKNINIWTAKSGWPGPGGTPPSFTPGAGTFLPLTLEQCNPLTPTGTHIHPSPYNYPNNRTMPLNPSVYPTLASLYGGGTTQVGIEVPLSWRLSNYWHETQYIIKLAIPGSYFLRLESGFYDATVFAVEGVPTTPMGAEYPGGRNAYWSWWTPADRFDWAPASGRLYESWIARLTAAQEEAVAAGDKLDIRFVIIWMGDNDAGVHASTPSGVATRSSDFGPAMRKFIDRVRQDIIDLDATSLPKHRIGIVGMKIHPAYGTTAVRAEMNAALEQIEDDDPYYLTIDPADYQNADDDPSYTFQDDSHLNHNGYLAMADDVFDLVVALESDGEDALGVENRVTLEEVRDRVKTYYERGRVKTDAANQTVNQHVNAALFQILNKVADNAYWLRRTQTLTISSDPLTPTTLPRHVHRLLRIERSNDPTYPVHFDVMGYTDSGRIRIVLKDATSADFEVHYITMPREVTRDEELIPLPYHLIEWLVVETTLRLARASSNTTLEQSLLLESQKMTEDCMRIIAANRHGAHDRLRSSRRLFRRKSGRSWWGR